MSNALPKYPNRIKEQIHAVGYTIREITEELNIAERTMRDYLTGRTAMPRTYLEALARVLGCTCEELLLPSSAPSSIWNVPYQQNAFFTGREDILTQLYAALHQKGTVAITQAHALCGLGGIGKTQIVLEYAYRYRDEYDAVLWVKSDLRENLLSDFLTLATLLNLPEQHAQDQKTRISAIQRWMQQHTAWLLIFDNADDLESVRQFIAPGSRGHIVLTTRAQALGRLADRLVVEIMDPETGALFLLRRAGLLGLEASLHDVSIEERDLACQLVQELGGLPLALDQAGAYIEETLSSLAGYLDIYRQQRFALLRRRGGVIEDHPESVATTWSLSFEAVERMNPAATDLMRLCAFLDPDAIPEELLAAGATALGPVLAPVATDPFRLNQAIEALWRYSLLRRHTSSHMLSLHRLVQVVLKESMSMELQQTWVERAIGALHLAFPSYVEPTCWETCQLLLPQVQQCSQLIDQWSIHSAEASTLLHQAAYYLGERGAYAEAEALYRQALSMRTECLGPEHLDTAQSRYNLARLSADQGRYAEAEQFYLQVLATRERIMGFEHPAIAQCLNSLALLYWFWEKYEQAEQLYLRALPMYQRLLGSKRPDTAHCMNNLALLYVTRAHYTEAERLHRQVLAIRQEVLPPVHPDTAQSLQNLACVYLAQGDPAMYEHAERLLLQSLAIREHVLGPEHPQTAKSLHNLALLYEVQGNDMEAEQLYQQALHIREQVHGRANPKTLATVEDYARLLRKMHREDEAVQLEAYPKLEETAL
jgi:tetratricopeptide (TPR) repeat protein